MKTVEPNSTESQDNSPKGTYRMMALVAIAILILMGLAIFSLSQMNTSARSGAPLPVPNLTSTLRQDLPHFEYSDQGKSLKSTDFSGKWTLLSFWAYWCGPCLQELPALNQMVQQWQGPEFEVITVNVDDAKTENFESAKKFLSEEEFTLPTLFDKTGILKRAFNVSDLPQHFLINPDMKIVWQARGAFLWNENQTRDQLLKIMEDAKEQDESKEPEDQGSDSETEE